jgi:hypothetical protein
VCCRPVADKFVQQRVEALQGPPGSVPGSDIGARKWALTAFSSAPGLPQFTCFGRANVVASHSEARLALRSWHRPRVNRYPSRGSWPWTNFLLTAAWSF